jgi:hypothetical protein
LQLEVFPDFGHFLHLEYSGCQIPQRAVGLLKLSTKALSNQLPRPDELQINPALIRPGIQRVVDELRTGVDETKAKTCVIEQSQHSQPRRRMDYCFCCRKKSLDSSCKSSLEKKA